MNSGYISYNSTNVRGGGVFLNAANFRMQGGTISNNETDFNSETTNMGGAIFLHNHLANSHPATFEMQGVTITNNTAKSQASIGYLDPRLTVTITGGNILNNYEFEFNEEYKVTFAPEGTLPTLSEDYYEYEEEFIFAEDGALPALYYYYYYYEDEQYNNQLPEKEDYPYYPYDYIFTFAPEGTYVFIDYQYEDIYNQYENLLTRWQRIITINYNGGGHNIGSPPASHSAPIPPGAIQLRFPGTMGRTGFRFVGWRDRGGNLFQAGETVFANSHGPATVTAVWQAQTPPPPPRPPQNRTITIHYFGNGHTGGFPPTSHVHNAPATISLRHPGNLVRAGHRFVGWTDGSGRTFNPGHNFRQYQPGIIHFHAVWQPIPQNHVVTIEYRGNGHNIGTVPARHSHNVPSNITLRHPGTMGRQNYTFRGWRHVHDGQFFQAGSSWFEDRRITHIHLFSKLNGKEIEQELYLMQTAAQYPQIIETLMQEPQ